jgi:hypothetical protein
MLTLVHTQPLNPATGTLFFDTALNKFRIYDGTTWNDLTVTDKMNKELITDELTFGGTTFYTVELKNYDWDNVYVWTRETFGPPRTDKGDHDKKWFISGGTFYFEEKKNRDWLILRWTGDNETN